MESTLVVTSCDRHDLLKETLESFIQFADQKPKRTRIIEDSAKPAPAWLDSVREPLGGILCGRHDEPVQVRVRDLIGFDDSEFAGDLTQGGQGERRGAAARP